jgi:hypothetical protein
VTAIACFVLSVGGVRYWVDPDDRMLARRLSFGSAPVEDLRAGAPFYQLLPCPYCGVEEDRGHDPLKHVDPRLGTPTAAGKHVEQPVPGTATVVIRGFSTPEGDPVPYGPGDKRFSATGEFLGEQVGRKPKGAS